MNISDFSLARIGDSTESIIHCNGIITNIIEGEKYPIEISYHTRIGEETVFVRNDGRMLWHDKNPMWYLGSIDWSLLNFEKTRIDLKMDDLCVISNLSETEHAFRYFSRYEGQNARFFTQGSNSKTNLKKEDFICYTYRPATDKEVRETRIIQKE